MELCPLGWTPGGVRGSWGARVPCVQTVPERARGLGHPTLLLGCRGLSSAPPAESPPPTPGPQTRLRPARTRFVWFSPSGLFLEFLLFSLFLDLWGPPSPPAAEIVGARILRPRRGHRSPHALIQELRLRSARTQLYWGCGSLTPASPSPPPSPPPLARARRGFELQTSRAGSDWGGGGGEALPLDQMLVSIPTSSAGARLEGARRSPRGRGVSPSGGAAGEGPRRPPLSAFLARRGCGTDHSQASFPSKLERAMAKACRAHSG